VSLSLIFVIFFTIDFFIHGKLCLSLINRDENVFIFYRCNSMVNYLVYIYIYIYIHVLHVHRRSSRVLASILSRKEYYYSNIVV
jgi:hypothetical protein